MDKAEHSALLIVNRNSRQGNSDMSEGIELLKARGIRLLDEESEEPQRTRELIRKHQNSVDSVILGGGDGTINAILETLIDCRLALGILPLGTANDLARTLNIPDSLMAACQIIAEGRLHPIDLGRVNGHYFLNAAHIGLGVKVIEQLSDETKAAWGEFGYARSLIEALRMTRAFRAHISCDGASIRDRSIHITIANGRYYGAGMTIDGAAIDDQYLHLYSLKPQRFWQLLRLAPALRLGRLKEQENIFLCKGKTIEIKTSKTLDVTADGEFKTKTPVRFEVVPNALQVYVPQNYERPREESDVAR